MRLRAIGSVALVVAPARYEPAPKTLLGAGLDEHRTWSSEPGDNTFTAHCGHSRPAEHPHLHHYVYAVRHEMSCVYNHALTFGEVEALQASVRCDEHIAITVRPQ